MKKSLLALLGVGVLSLPSLASAYVIGPTSPGKWGNPTPGTGATITWSLMPTGTSCAAEFAGCTITALADFMPAGYLAQIQAAFDAWSAVADLTFIQVADDGAAFDAPTTSGSIRLGGHSFDGVFGILAHCFYPPVNGDTAAGDCHFDTAETWKIDFSDPGISIFQVTAHELGHGLGLDHTSVPDSLMNAFYSEAFVGPQADDIAGMQYLYGAPASVPEPTSLSLLAIGLCGALRRRGARTA
jgi:hypothetical protein